MRRKAHGERFSLRGERRSLLGKTKLWGGGDRLSLRGEWQNSRAEGKAPPFEFLPLLSTCPLGFLLPLGSPLLGFLHPLLLFSLTSSTP